MNHIYMYEDGTFLTHHRRPSTDLQEAAVARKASISAQAGSVNATRKWKKLPKLTGKAVPVVISFGEQAAPKAIVGLYEEAQINSDMDQGTYVGGCDQYGVDRILEAIAKMVGWKLPKRMTLEERKQWLRDLGREDEIEYLGVNGG